VRGHIRLSLAFLATSFPTRSAFRTQGSVAQSLLHSSSPLEAATLANLSSIAKLCGPNPGTRHLAFERAKTAPNMRSLPDSREHSWSLFAVWSRTRRSIFFQELRAFGWRERNTEETVTAAARVQLDQEPSARHADGVVKRRRAITN
jgi:hypothetical protein